ncbi:MAG TPA: redoxin domain-containing protein [Phycisphaerae bacterium]|nr:redoxin domain-containing protein [Phycisphaerae bacterium]
MAELRGLGEVNTELKEQGGRLLAIAVDPPERARQVVEGNGLEFSILCDTERRVIGDYGLVHAGGGPEGTDIALPAHLLVDTDGRVVWRFVSRRVEDRVHPDDVLEAVRSLKKSATAPTEPVDAAADSPTADSPAGPITQPTPG